MCGLGPRPVKQLLLTRIPRENEINYCRPRPVTPLPGRASPGPWRRGAASRRSVAADPCPETHHRLLKDVETLGVVPGPRLGGQADQQVPLGVDRSVAGGIGRRYKLNARRAVVGPRRDLASPHWKLPRTGKRHQDASRLWYLHDSTPILTDISHMDRATQVSGRPSSDIRSEAGMIVKSHISCLRGIMHPSLGGALLHPGMDAHVAECSESSTGPRWPAPARRRRARRLRCRRHRTRTRSVRDLMVEFAAQPLTRERTLSRADGATSFGPSVEPPTCIAQGRTSSVYATRGCPVRTMGAVATRTASSCRLCPRFPPRPRRRERVLDAARRDPGGGVGGPT